MQTHGLNKQFNVSANKHQTVQFQDIIVSVFTGCVFYHIYDLRIQGRVLGSLRGLLTFGHSQKTST